MATSKRPTKKVTFGSGFDVRGVPPHSKNPFESQLVASGFMLRDNAEKGMIAAIEQGWTQVRIVFK